ncbi:MAG: dipeptidase PepE [Dehalococcoidia bacterium]
MTADILLLSGGGINLEPIDEFLGDQRSVLFAPYALADQDRYTARIQEVLAPLNVSVVGLDRVPDPAEAIGQAAILFVGGGNSFRLLGAFQRLGLLEIVRRRVRSGALRYLGSSAGSNLACPTIRTTNDMPIVELPSLKALGLIPFQINPHYQDADPNSTHQGETREQRLLQFLEENDVPVLGLREGAWLRRTGEQALLGGQTGARLFLRGAEPRELREGADLSWLLGLPARFDAER